MEPQTETQVIDDQSWKLKQPVARVIGQIVAVDDHVQAKRILKHLGLEGRTVKMLNETELLAFGAALDGYLATRPHF